MSYCICGAILRYRLAFPLEAQMLAYGGRRAVAAAAKYLRAVAATAKAKYK